MATAEKDCRRLSIKITIGVCVMDKKASSGPMLQILERLQAFGEFEVISSPILE
ncbi:hypothetical protein M569_12511 [Genlisea aurea]|uniref:VIP1 N-terminal domain-containing protein n=1 Tax=Genlisea aurea TaxID=192259 RepID=S8CCW2_9LAMI|nr:hypothetical protein M569_12511 [Genlisea aurea]